MKQTFLWITVILACLGLLAFWYVDRLDPIKPESKLIEQDRTATAPQMQETPKNEQSQLQERIVAKDAIKAPEPELVLAGEQYLLKVGNRLLSPSDLKKNMEAVVEALDDNLTRYTREDFVVEQEQIAARIRSFQTQAPKEIANIQIEVDDTGLVWERVVYEDSSINYYLKGDQRHENLP